MQLGICLLGQIEVDSQQPTSTKTLSFIITIVLKALLDCFRCFVAKIFMNNNNE